MRASSSGGETVPRGHVAVKSWHAAPRAWIVDFVAGSGLLEYGVLGSRCY
jgi:hypothetical protein